MTQDPTPDAVRPRRRTMMGRFLDWVERVGNRLPDPAILFVWGLAITAVLSALLAPVHFTEHDPRLIPEVRKYQKALTQNVVATVGALAAPGAGPWNAVGLTPQLAPPESTIRINN